MTEKVKKFITAFMSALSNCSLYSSEHESVDICVKKAFSLLEDIFREAERLEIMIVDNDLIVNKIPLREAGIHGINIVKRLKKKGITCAEFEKDITPAELKDFIIEIADAGRDVSSHPHIKTGVIDLRRGGQTDNVFADIDSRDMHQLTNDQFERVKAVFHGISSFLKLNIGGLDEITTRLAPLLRKKSNMFQIIKPAGISGEYNSSHAFNVAILAMSHAETMGIKDELLNNIGAAALLHDVGKLFISKEVFEKKAGLDERDCEEIKMHTVYGAKFLARVNGLTPLALIVAFEHHMGYDGKGYPAPGAITKKQHFCAQMVAVSDLFDIIINKKPYKKEEELKETLALLKRISGSALNPLLVDSFSKMLLTASQNQ